MDAATFRALRETVGLSQRAVAEAQGVSEKTVKLWERSARGVPERVARWMTERVGEHDRAVADTVASMMRMVDDTNESMGLPSGHRPPIAMSYWRTQADYDAMGRDAGDVGMVNARSRAVAAALRGLGYEVEFTYFPVAPDA